MRGKWSRDRIFLLLVEGDGGTDRSMREHAILRPARSHFWEIAWLPFYIPALLPRFLAAVKS